MKLKTAGRSEKSFFRNSIRKNVTIFLSLQFIFKVSNIGNYMSVKMGKIQHNLLLFWTDTVGNIGTVTTESNKMFIVNIS